MESVFDAVLLDEKERNLCARIEERNLPLRIETLLKGDFTVSSRVGGEIKRIKKTPKKTKEKFKIDDYNDLWASVKDNRIYTEIDGLNKMYEINVLIIQIEKGASFFSPFFTLETWKSLWRSLEFGFNTHIHITHTDDETIDLIYSIWEREKKGKHYVSPCNKKPRPPSLREQQMYFISGLINVGDKTSKELLEIYRTPWNILKLLVETKIKFTKSNKPKKPENAPFGYGGLFFLKNQILLTSDPYEQEEENKEKEI